MVNVLEIACNVTSAASLIFQNAVLKSQCENTSKLALLDGTLGGGLNLDSSDLESPRCRGGATGWSRSLGQGDSGSRKGEGNEGSHVELVDLRGYT